MPASYDLSHVAAVLRQLRAGPVTVPQIVERTGIERRAVSRMIAALEQAGAPIVSEQLELEGPGRPPTGLKLTVAGLREWLG